MPLTDAAVRQNLTTKFYPAGHICLSRLQLTRTASKSDLVALYDSTVQTTPRSSVSASSRPRPGRPNKSCPSTAAPRAAVSRLAIAPGHPQLPIVHSEPHPIASAPPKMRVGSSCPITILISDLVESITNDWTPRQHRGAVEGGVMAEEGAMTECPYCREEVKSGAIRCKHCHAAIPAAKPGHEGVCPFCKEDINPEATRCRHCKADLAETGRAGCAPCTPTVDLTRRRPVGRRLQRRAVSRATRTARDFKPWACWDCADIVQLPDSPGDWVIVDCDDDYCYYEHDLLSYP